MLHMVSLWGAIKGPHFDWLAHGFPFFSVLSTLSSLEARVGARDTHTHHTIQTYFYVGV